MQDIPMSGFQRYNCDKDRVLFPGCVIPRQLARQELALVRGHAGVCVQHVLYPRISLFQDQTQGTIVPVGSKKRQASQFLQEQSGFKFAHQLPFALFPR